MFKEGKITKKDVALVLECSDDYIDWLMDKVEKSYNRSSEK